MGWIPTALLACVSITLLVKIVQNGYPVTALIGPLGTGLSAIGFARVSMSGIITESWGIKARNTLRTYSWRWDEIDHFELRARGEVPRFRVHLSDGRIQGFLGFFARSTEQEERGQAFFRELAKRLEVEQAKSMSETNR
jgi:hypothetical protein